MGHLHQAFDLYQVLDIFMRKLGNSTCSREGCKKGALRYESSAGPTDTPVYDTHSEMPTLALTLILTRYSHNEKKVRTYR